MNPIALDTIFAVCPRLALLVHLKYGLFPCPHGSPVPPHGYPDMMPRLVNLLIQT